MRTIGMADWIDQQMIKQYPVAAERLQAMETLRTIMDVRIKCLSEQARAEYDRELIDSLAKFADAHPQRVQALEGAARKLRELENV